MISEDLQPVKEGDPDFHAKRINNLFKSRISNYLKNAKIDILKPDDCKNYLQLNITTDWTSTICAGILSGGTDTCQGDSGGPLFVLDTLNGKQKFVLVGITSNGLGIN